MAMVKHGWRIKRLSVIGSVLVLGPILTVALYSLVRVSDSDIGNQTTALRNAGPTNTPTGTLPDTPAPESPTPTDNGHEHLTDMK